MSNDGVLSSKITASVSQFEGVVNMARQRVQGMVTSYKVCLAVNPSDSKIMSGGVVIYDDAQTNYFADRNFSQSLCC
jgi:hypothetical protein